MAPGKTLDLAFTVDCTASMSKYIEQARQNISKIVEHIATAGGFQVRFALNEYRDHPPQKQGFVTRSNGFTTSQQEMSKWLNRCAQIKNGLPADMCFVLDSSGSVGASDFAKEKRFVTDLINALHISDDMVRVGVITYSNDVHVSVSVNDNNVKVSLKNAVDRINYLGGCTNTGPAIARMTNIMNTSSSRKLIQKLGIVITDGCSHDYNEVVYAVNEAKSKGIRMISVGVGDGVNEKELQTIASHASLVHQVGSFEALNDIKQHIIADAVRGFDEGADEPEAMEDGLYDTLRLDWQSDVKMCVLIADQPPHGLCHRDHQHDNYPNGCPDGHDPMVLAEKLAEKGVSIYVVGCEPSVTPYRDFFMAVARMTGGLYIPLSDSTSLTDVITGAAEEEISLRENMDIVENEVKKELDKYDGDVDKVDEQTVSETLMELLKDNTTKHLQLDGGALPPVSARAKRFARFPTIADVKKKFIPTPAQLTPGQSGATFTVVEKPIDILQVQRMVQKAIMIHQPNA